MQKSGTAYRVATYGTPYRVDRSWAIAETGADGITVSVAITGPDDRTAGELNRYDPACSACWLGHAHSGDYHRASVGGAC